MKRKIFRCRILAITAVGSIFAGYLLATALYSPDMLLGLDVGGTLTLRTLVDLSQLKRVLLILMTTISHVIYILVSFWRWYHGSSTTACSRTSKFRSPDCVDVDLNNPSSGAELPHKSGPPSEPCSCSCWSTWPLGCSRLTTCSARRAA